MIDLEKIEKTAKLAAIEAGKVCKNYFGQAIAVEVKDELSPLVTIADRQSEIIMRDIIKAEFPSHIIIGEEFGADKQFGDISPDDITWALDPIDGTSAFTAGLPTFVVLIGVWLGGEPLLGLIYQPITGDMWLASGSTPTKRNDIACTAQKRPLVIATTSPEYLTASSQVWWDKLVGGSVTAVYGGDGHLYGSLASGQISLVFEQGLKWHDVSALIPVVENAGCIICDHEGERLKPYQDSYKVIASKDKQVLDWALGLKEA